MIEDMFLDDLRRVAIKWMFCGGVAPGREFQFYEAYVWICWFCCDRARSKQLQNKSLEPLVFVIRVYFNEVHVGRRGDLLLCASCFRDVVDFRDGNHNIFRCSKCRRRWLQNILQRHRNPHLQPLCEVEIVVKIED